MGTINTPRRIAIFGAGAWGTALALSLSEMHEVVLWSHDAEHVCALNEARENKRYLPGFALPSGLFCTEDLQIAACHASLHIIATPLAGLRPTLQALHRLAPETPLLWACKGLEADSGQLAHEIVDHTLGEGAPCGLLSGPSFAREVAAGQPTALVLASRDAAFAKHWASCLHKPLLRLYASTDLAGCELGGALKNVIAIAAGIADAQNFGFNARAALITRGLAEITRLAIELGGQAQTLMGLAGMGDLILTATGDLSRNRQVGLALGRGQSLAHIMSELGHVAEGVPCAHAAVRLAQRCGVELPICQEVARLLASDQPDPHAAVERLLGREPGQE